jgi:hypothetical protein
MAPPEEVIPDSEDNGKTADTSDDDDNDDAQKQSSPNTRKSVPSGLSDWKQKLRDIDDQYDTDDDSQGPHEIPDVLPGPKGVFQDDPFASPLTTQTASQHNSHQSRADEPLSSPTRGVSSSTNTTPQFLFGTPGSLSPTPPTSDGKPSPMSKTAAAQTKGKGKGRAPFEAVIDDQLASSPDPIRRTRRSEKPKKAKVRSLFIFISRPKW